MVVINLVVDSVGSDGPIWYAYVKLGKKNNPLHRCASKWPRVPDSDTYRKVGWNFIEPLGMKTPFEYTSIAYMY